MNGNNISGIQKLRLGSQLLVLLWLVSAPFLDWFRLDLNFHLFYLFGKAYHISKILYFFTAFFTVVILLFVISLLLGRVLCGWACPYNTLQEFLTRVFLMKKSSPIKKALYYLLVAILSFGVAYSIEAYFFSPFYILALMVTEQVTKETVLLFVLFLLFFWVFLRLRHRFCKGICPYASLQMLISRKPMRVAFDVDHQDDCLNCEMCQKVCHMDIDPKDMEIENCVTCGKCMDGCEDIISAYHQTALLSFKKLSHDEYLRRKKEDQRAESDE